MKISAFCSPKTSLILLSAVFPAMTGCASRGWKPSSLLPWKRNPDVAAMSDAESVELPPSPATKYTPNAITSVGAQSPYSSNDPNAGAASAYGYTAQTVATPKAGLAAQANGFAGQANGYQTGPYQLGLTPTPASTPATVPPPAASSPSGARPAGSSGMSTASNLPNPYGGTYMGTPSQGRLGIPPAVNSTKAPDIALPTGMPSNLASSSNLPASYPSSNLPVSTAPGKAVGPYTMVGYPKPTTLGTVGETSSVPTPDLPSYPSLLQGQAPMVGASGLNSPQTAYGSMGNSSASAVSGTGTAAFAPGTTGRNTKYNFGASQPASSGTTDPILR